MFILLICKTIAEKFTLALARDGNMATGKILTLAFLGVIIFQSFTGSSADSRIIQGFSLDSSKSTRGTDGTQHRVKRSHFGDGVPHAFDLQCKAFQPAEFHVGSLLAYKCVISASTVETDVVVELFSELHDGLPYFMISNVRLGNVGSNLETFSVGNTEIIYDSDYQSGRCNYVTVHLGKIVSSAADPDTVEANQLEIYFEAQSVLNEGLVDGQIYRISGGYLLDSSIAEMVQLDVKYVATADDPPRWSYGQFSAEGPDTLSVGKTGVWKITASIFDLNFNLMLDVVAPMADEEILSIDSISVAYIGKNYRHSLHDGTVNLTKKEFEDYGTYARLDFGYIVNSGFYNKDYDLDKNTIIIEVAITMLDHVLPVAAYELPFMLWKGGEADAELSFLSIQSVLPTAEEPLSLVAPDAVTVTPSVDVVPYGGRFGVLVDVSIPADSTVSLKVEVGSPLTADNKAVVDLERIRVSETGFNVPHFINDPRVVDTYTKTLDMQHTHFASIALDRLCNTGQRSGPSDNIVQIEIAGLLLESAVDTYPSGDSLPLTVTVTISDSHNVVVEANIQVSGDPVTYTSAEMPTLTLANVMGVDAKLYMESAAVMDLDIVVPVSMSYQEMQIDIETSDIGGPGSLTLVKVVGIDIAHVGSSIMLDKDNATYTGVADEVEENGDEVYNKVTLTLHNVANLRRSDTHKTRFKESTFRVRTYVIAREAATPANLYSGIKQWVDATVDVASQYTFTAAAQLEYADTYNMYSGSDWQPRISLDLAEGYNTSSLGLGAFLKYNLAVNIPYRTSAYAKAKAESVTSPVQICLVELTSMGSGIVQYYPPKYTDVRRVYDDDTRRLVNSYNSIPTITSYGYGDHVDTNPDTFVNYTVIVMLDDTAVIGQPYSFHTEFQFGLLDMVEWTESLDTTDQVPTVDVRPVFSIVHLMETDTINIGGSEVFYFDMYIPPSTSHKYIVRILAPHSASMFGDYEILEAFIVSAGEDLACFNAWTTEVTLPNSATDENLALFAIGFVPNVAVGDFSLDEESGFIPGDNNRVRLAVHVALLANTSLAAGSTIPITASVDINNGADKWIGSLDVEILPPEDTRNVVPPSNLTMYISAQEDMIFSVGETQTYDGVINLPPGVALTEFQLTIESPLMVGEALFTVSQPQMIFFGSNLDEARKYKEFSEEENDYFHLYTHTIDFGFVRNLNRSGISDFINRTYDGENQIKFQFSLRLMDHVTLKDSHQFEMIAHVTFGNVNGTENVTAEGDTTLTVSAPPEDTTLFDWSISLLDLGDSDVVFDSVISCGLELGLLPTSTRFPDNVTVFYRVPSFSTLVPNSVHFSGLDNAFSYTDEVNQQGLQFRWNRLRYENDAKVNFSIIVDPDKYLEFGLLTKYIHIAVDIQYFEEDKSNLGVFTELYTGAQVLKFPVVIPECLGPLGMGDDNILDCQISSSIDDGTHTAVSGRAGGNSGWVTMDRGSPFYQHEYIQVDVGYQVRIGGVTIQPFNDADAHRITSFKVQYSWKGILWEYVKESGVEKVFTVTWPDPTTSSTSVLVEFGSLAFYTRYIRILPQENAESSYIHKLRFDLNGCPWPYKTSPAAYNCPAAADPVKAYFERQMLAVKDTVLVCLISEPNTLPYCSGSNDFGVTWFAFDDNVMNILGYEADGEGIYALARNRLSTLRSTDKGHTWAMVEEDDFTAMSSLSTYTTAKELPFPLQGSTTSELFVNYGFTDDETFTWTASNMGLHAYSTDTAGVGSKSTAEGKVARWGSTDWNP